MSFGMGGSHKGTKITKKKPLESLLEEIRSTLRYAVFKGPAAL